MADRKSAPRRTGLSQALQEAGDDPKGTSLQVNRIGCDYFEKGFLHKALDAFKKAHELVPGFAGYAANLAAAQLSLGQKKEALAAVVGHRMETATQASVVVNLGAALGENDEQDLELDWYRKHLDRFPDEPKILHNLAISYMELGDAERAVVTADRLVQEHPEWPKAYFVRGCALSQAGRHEEEAQCYERALELKEDYVEAHTNLGAVLRELQKFDRAAQIFCRLAALQPNDPQPPVDEAICQWLGGRTREAQETIEKSLQVRAGYHPALTTKALFLVHSGDHEKAVAAIEKAQELYPNALETHFSRGLVLKMTGDLEGALAALDRCLEIAPGREAVLAHKAEVLTKLGRFAEAVQSLEELVARERSDVFSRALLARALMEDGQRTRALQVAREAADISSADVPMLRILGEVLLDVGAPEDALEIFGRVLKLHDQDVEAAHAIGVIHSRARRYDQAIDYFERAFRLRPDHGQAAYNLATIHYTRGNYELAGKVLDLAVKAAPEHLKARHLLGKTRMKLGLHAEALRAWEEALELKPESTSVIKKLIEVSVELGDRARIEQYMALARDIKARRRAAGSGSRDLTESDLGLD